MAIVARGLGQPEDGALVAGGLGRSTGGGGATPGPMVAALVGTGTLTGELTATGSIVGGSPGGALPPGYFQWPSQRPQRPQTKPRQMVATLGGIGTLTGDLGFTVDFDAELEQLLLVGAL